MYTLMGALAASFLFLMSNSSSAYRPSTSSPTYHVPQWGRPFGIPNNGYCVPIHPCSAGTLKTHV